MSRKKEIIKYIKKLINENGSFSVSDIDGIVSLSPVNKMGKLVAIAENFDKDSVQVHIYDPNSFTGGSIADPYYLTYDELSLELLEEIEELCDYIDAENYKTKKRISN